MLPSEPEDVMSDISEDIVIAPIPMNQTKSEHDQRGSNEKRSSQKDQLDRSL